MDIPTFSVNRKILINMIFIILVILGLNFYSNMPREFFPNAHLNQAYVIVPYPGASSLEVEQQVVNKIEEAIEELDGLDEMESRAQESSGVVTLYIEDGTDIDKFILDLQSSVNNINDFPEGAEDPIFLELDASLASPICFVALGGDMEEGMILKVAEDIKKEFLLIEGVKKVEIDGLAETEVHIDVDPALLNHHRISLGEIIGALGNRNVDLPGGKAELGPSEYSLRVLGKYRDLEGIRNTVIRTGRNNSELRLGQVAGISFQSAEASSVNRLNGERAGNMIIYKNARGNAITIMQEVRQILARYNETLPIPVNLEIRLDTSELIEERLGIMTNNAWVTAILVGLVLFFFLGWTNSLLVLIGIPFTFLTGFLFMSMAGMSINMLTLFALIMALGMVVDDAIVVVDNIQRYIELGVPPREAAIRGSREVIGPVTSAVLTTVAGFLPLLFMTGMVGKFISAIPKTVAFALLASLVEAIFILPSHSYELNEFSAAIRRRFGRSKSSTPEALPVAAKHPVTRTGGNGGIAGVKGGFRAKRNPVMARMQGFYRKNLLFVLRYRYLALLLVLIMAAFSVRLVGMLPKKMFPDEDFDQIVLQYELPPGTPLEETSASVLEMERLVKNQVSDVELKGIVSYAGYQIRNYEYIRGSHLAELNLDLVSAADRERSDLDIMTILRPLIAGVPGVIDFQMKRPDNGPPTGTPVEILILGPRFEVLEGLGELVKAELGTIPGVVDIRDDFDRSIKEFRIEVDESRARTLGLSNFDVATTINSAFQGFEATQYTNDAGEDLPVIVQLARPYRDDLETLNLLKVQNRQGDLIPLAGLAGFEEGLNFSAIRHYEKERSYKVLAELADGQTSTAVNTIMQEKLATFASDHPGYHLHFGGEFERTAETFTSLFLLLPIAFLAIFMILATQFNSIIQPLIVIFTVPLSFIGVTIGLLVMGYDFSIPSMVGIISLMGLVVNNSLVMVDFINKSRERGVGRWFSIVRSGVIRMRPILLTAVTTIVGLSSLTFATTGASRIMVPMAVSMIWGLAFATILTLFLIPALVGIVDDIGMRIRIGKTWQQYGGK
ncbi:MAG: efflux RND transporter permease subunit [bacterium]|nr:efflux RND transporter permease subunit [bacterium]